MTTETVEWNNKMALRLIDAYRERPQLWDTTTEEYKDKAKKHEAWLEVARELGLEKEAVYRKMKILLTQYNRECKQRTAPSKWFAFHRMSFLKWRYESASPAPPATPASPAEFVAYTDTSEAKQEIEFEAQFEDGTSEEASYETPVNPMLTAVLTSSRKRTAAAACRRESDASGDTRRDSSHGDAAHDVRDEYSVFGEYVALKLRKINPYARCKAQQRIHAALYDAEAGHL